MLPAHLFLNTENTMKIKNHSKLKLSFAEFGALLGTRTLLANNAVVDAKGSQRTDEKTHKFNMEVACKVSGCGSVACIGGTMAQIMGMEPDEAVSYVHLRDPHENGQIPISRLFFPPQEYDFGKITPAHAVKAIDNFLATGKPLWNKVLPKSILEKDDED